MSVSAMDLTGKNEKKEGGKQPVNSLLLLADSLLRNESRVTSLLHTKINNNTEMCSKERRSIVCMPSFFIHYQFTTWNFIKSI